MPGREQTFRKCLCVNRRNPWGCIFCDSLSHFPMGPALALCPVSVDMGTGKKKKLHVQARICQVQGHPPWKSWRVLRLGCRPRAPDLLLLSLCGHGCPILPRMTSWSHASHLQCPYLLSQAFVEGRGSAFAGPLNVGLFSITMTSAPGLSCLGKCDSLATGC